MLNKILDFFNSELTATEDGHLSEQQCRIATAALLIEVAKTDHHFDTAEMTSLEKLLRQEFELSTEQLQTLIQLAQEEQRQATSVYQFTQLINQHCHVEDKYKLILGMWKIAYADGVLDKYEEHIIRKVADLIYVSHSDFIRAKMRAKES